MGSSFFLNLLVKLNKFRIENSSNIEKITLQLRNLPCKHLRKSENVVKLKLTCGIFSPYWHGVK